MMKIEHKHSVSDPLGKSDPNFSFFGLGVAALIPLAMYIA